MDGVAFFDTVAPTGLYPSSVPHDPGDEVNERAHLPLSLIKMIG